MRVLIRCQSGLMPKADGFRTETTDGRLYVWLKTLADLWKLQKQNGHDVAVTDDGLLVIDDYYD